jgi:predicted AAA+ superfamily ATPase
MLQFSKGDVVYIKRSITSTIYDLLRDFKIVSINGPRQSGKTTLAKEIATDLGMAYYTFDDDATKTAAETDPVNFIKRLSLSPCVIDEIQMVPEVVGALKRVVDEHDQNGMFLLTGSADLFKISTIKESLAGRMVSVSLYPLSYFEIDAKNGNIVDALFTNSFQRDEYDAIEYQAIVENILSGGYPPILGKSEKSRELWFESYIEARIEKDLSLIKRVSQENKSEITKLLRILAANTSNLLRYSSLAKHLSIKDVTVKSDIEILEALFLIRRINPYFTNRGKREIKAPKVAFIDTGLVSHLIDADANALILSQREILGNLVENFLYSELLKHTTFAQKMVKIYHYRDSDYEVDLVLERKDGKIVGIEVKSGTNIKDEHLKGLIRLAQNAGENFLHGFIFYGGDKILPISKANHTFWLIPLGMMF